MKRNYEDSSKIFKALCDPNRLQIIDILRGGEECACKLLDVLDIGQPTLSHHMKILCDSGLVIGRRDGKWMRYCLWPKGIQKAKQLLAEYTDIKTVV